MLELNCYEEFMNCHLLSSELGSWLKLCQSMMSLMLTSPKPAFLIELN